MVVQCLAAWAWAPVWEKIAPMPNTAIAQQLFSSCAAHGGSAWDHSGMVRALEMMANYEVQRPGQTRNT